MDPKDPAKQAKDLPVERNTLFEEARREADRYKWIESEKAGHDLGDDAIRHWHRRYWSAWSRERWIEHLRGEKFWVELDRGDYGLIKQQLSSNVELAQRIVERIRSGSENLDIIQWAVDEGYNTRDILDVLKTLDINSRRLTSEVSFEQDEPVTSGVPPKRVLVVDDDDDTRQMLREIFESEGLECLSAPTGEEAIALVQQKRIHCFLVDLMLPGKHGAEVAWYLRRHGIRGPIIAISAMLEHWNHDDLYDCGFTGLMAKPFKVGELRELAQDVKKSKV